MDSYSYIHITPTWFSFCHTYNKGVPFYAQKMSSVFIWPVLWLLCLLAHCAATWSAASAQMGVELRAVAMLTRFPACNNNSELDHSPTQGQHGQPLASGVDMCSHAYPPVVHHIHIQMHINNCGQS